MLKQSLVNRISEARALVYSVESLPLPLINSLIGGQKRKQISMDQQTYIVEKVQELLQLDAQEFVELDLPISLLAPEAPHSHFFRYLNILKDSFKSSYRRRNNKTREFSKSVKNLEDFPEYYRRNFHHQTDGYLSAESAQIYEHQVELLFRGTADPMRRRLLKPLKEKIQSIRKPKILEIACGVGTFTRSLQAAFPNSEVTAVDLSPSYIKSAKSKLKDFDNVHFMVADAENLPFKDQQFDAVVSVYLHHELPRKVRENVLKESLRVTNKQGFWGMLDSIQMDDHPQLNWAIKDFPKTFHEPFFKNYINHPILDYLNSLELNREFRQQDFLLSKVICG